MSDESPLLNVKGGRRMFSSPERRITYRVGRKCIVNMRSDGWLCVHGLDKKRRDLVGDIDPKVLYEADRSQARVYFHPGGTITVQRPQQKKDQCLSSKNEPLYSLVEEVDMQPEALVVTPSDIPFRSSAKGRTAGSKCFTADGCPAPQILLLYALKTKKSRDRQAALEAVLEVSRFPELNPLLKPQHSLLISGDRVDMHRVSKLMKNEQKYKKFVGAIMAETACRVGGLSDWGAWEKVADRAAEEALERIEKYGGDRNPDFDAKFLIAVREAAIEHGGLPVQGHVRKLWEDLGTQGEWKDNRSKLGFDWLPSLREWERDWRPMLDSNVVD